MLFPNGAPHALSSEKTGRLTPWAHLANAAEYEHTRAIELGPAPARTRILCASYHHDPAVRTPLFALLPAVLHIPADSLTPTLSDTVRLMATEIASRELASATVLDKLVDIVLIHLLRGWLRADPFAAPVSWLRALADEAVRAALSAMHADPARPWTAELLAAEVAASRSTLIRKFAALVGDPPSAYLTRWRMDLAARQLRDSDQPVDVIARSVGYRSVYAFTRAFARERSLQPARYRAISRAELSAD